jgi:hypothetical protein
MVYKQKVENTVSGRTEGRPALPPEISELLGRVQRLLDAGQADKALDTIKHSRLKSEWVTNAIAVCLLREGETKRAADLLRTLAGGPGGVTLRTDAPLVFKTNFATALLAGGQVAGCLGVLREISDEQNLTVQALRTAIDQWKKTLSLWQRLKWAVGDFPEHPLSVPGIAGDLE